VGLEVRRFLGARGSFEHGRDVVYVVEGLLNVWRDCALGNRGGRSPFETASAGGVSWYKVAG
jgi:hypothetical protein